VLTETHGILMRGSRGDHAEVGAFRRRQNWIGSRARAPVTEALFVPPPPGETLERGIDDWERWVNDRSITLPTVVKTALAHYQFEALHPFIDGNGRIGRLVVVLTFIAAGDLAIPLLNVSPFFERARDEYIDHLRTVSETGDFEPWVAFFAEAVRVQAQLGLTKAEELIGVRDQITQRLRDVGVRGTAIRIAENIIGYPVTTVARAAEQSGVSYESANSAVGRLVDEGVLHEITGGNYRRVFVAQEVLDIINR
jgi:Fic family protein